jgi:hypothetical protein
MQIIDLPYQREGIVFTFAGAEPDETGEASGEPVKIELIVPPLNFHALRRIEQIEKDTSREAQTVAAIELALKRNYRGVPRWLIEQTLDVGNAGAFNKALMDVDGKYREEAEKKANPSTGTVSTPI